jgi:hypothetical protein
MERLPYIDEHAITVSTDRTTTWRALVHTMCSNPEDPETVPFGFVLDTAEQPTRLALKGRHWFAVYSLVFLLGEVDGGTRVTAQTWAAFPGVKGRLYRALVIGSGGHRLVVQRMLRHIAAQALSFAASRR